MPNTLTSNETLYDEMESPKAKIAYFGQIQEIKQPLSMTSLTFPEKRFILTSVSRLIIEIKSSSGSNQ